MTHAGRSIIEMLWEQADIKYAEFCELHEETGGYSATKWTTENVDEAIDYLNTQGQLQGLVYAIAKMQNPYENTKTQMEAVKAELRERWEEE